MTAESHRRLIVSAHGVLTMAPEVQALSGDEERAPDPTGAVITRSVALGLASFRTTPSDGEPQYEELYAGTERWSQEEVAGDWRGDGRVRELIGMRLLLDRASRPRQRLPVQQTVGVIEDICCRLGSVSLTGLHTDLPLAVASDVIRDLAASQHWFRTGARQEPTELCVALRFTRPEEAEQARTSLPAELARFEAVHVDALPSVKPGTFESALVAEAASFGETADAVESSADLDPSLLVAFHCEAVEWSFDLAAWTVELFGELTRRSVGGRRVAVRVAHG